MVQKILWNKPPAPPVLFIPPKPPLSDLGKVALLNSAGKLAALFKKKPNE